MRENIKEKLLKRIQKIQKTLEAEEKKIGWIKDRRGMRYFPTEYYLKMENYTEGLVYLQWFNKHFSNDKGFPEFLFECSIILFKNGKLKDAEKKVFQTYCSNVYFFDKYFGNPIIQIEKFEKTDSESAKYINFIHFANGQSNYEDYDKWLEQFLSSEKFIENSKKFIEIRKQYQTEKDLETRKKLIRQEQNLIYEL